MLFVYYKYVICVDTGVRSSEHTGIPTTIIHYNVMRDIMILWMFVRSCTIINVHSRLHLLQWMKGRPYVL